MRRAECRTAGGIGGAQFRQPAIERHGGRQKRAAHLMQPRLGRFERVRERSALGDLFLRYAPHYVGRDIAMPPALRDRRHNAFGHIALFVIALFIIALFIIALFIIALFVAHLVSLSAAP